MNLKDKRVRRKAVAFAGASVVVVAGGVTLAEFASATGTLTATPSATSITVPNLGAAATAGSTSGHSLVQSLADAAFAARVTSTLSTNLKLSVDSYTAPTGVTVAATKYLYTSEVTPGGSVGPTANTTNGPWTRTDVSAATSASPVLVNLTGNASTATKDVFLAFNAPGTYTYHFVDAGPTAGTDDDLVSPTVTVTVKDVNAVTASTADDLTATVTATSSVTQGTAITSTVDLSGLTLADSRGTSSGAGILGSKLAALVGVQYSGAVTSATAATTFGTTNTVRTLAGGSVSATGTVTSTANFDNAGNGLADADPDLGTATTTVANNAVSTFTLAPTAVVGTVSTTPKVKTGTATVDFTATVDTLSTGTDKSGKTFFFTLTPGTNTPTLTADGTLVSNNSGVKVYSATTNASGVATLKVTSSITTVGTTYTVAADTNSVGSQTKTVTYEDAAATTAKFDASSSALYPTVGATSVTVSGSVLDQFGAAFVPATGASTSVLVEVDEANSSVASIDKTAYGTLSGGNFTASYTPTAAATAGQQDSFRILYALTGTPVLASGTGSVWWTSATAPAAVSITAPVDASTGQTLQSKAAPGSGIPVSGLVTDANGAGLANKVVTLTGGEGVYFTDSATPSSTHVLSTSAVARTNGSGAYSGLYVFFTKAGVNTIKATAGVSKTISVTTAVPTDAYKAIAIDAAGTSGSVIVVTGKVLDAFGNPVPSTYVDLSTGSSTLGALGASKVQTNSDGVWSTTFTAGANQNGTATLTATLYNSGSSTVLQTADATAHANWATASTLTIAAGSYQDTATLTIGSGAPTLSGPAKASAGSVTLTGTAPANAQVDIYAKKAGSSDAFAWVGSAKADGTTGDWSKAVTVSASTTFIAKVGTAASSEVTVALNSTTKASVTVTGKALGGKKALISVKGSPAKASTVVLYIKSGSKWVKVRTVTTTSAGTTSITVKTSTGTKTFKVVYTAPGSSAVSKTVSVKVK